MTQVEKRRNFIINAAYFILLVLFLALFLKFAFYPLLPIFLALLVGILLQRPMKFISAKTKIPKSIVGTVLVLLIVFLIFLAVYAIGDTAITEISGFVSVVTDKFTDYEWIESQANGIVEKMPAFLHDSVKEKTDFALENLKSILSEDADIAENTYRLSFSSFDFSKIMGGVKSGVSIGVSGLVATAKQLPGILLAIIMGIILACFITIEYEEVLDIINRVIGPKNSELFTHVRRVMKETVGKLAKSYAIICFMTFVELSIGLFILKLIGVYTGGYIVIIALVTAILDILPVLGIGTVMWPWMAYCVFSGDTAMLIGLLAIYAVITVIRHIIEPKLISDAVELPAAIMLAVMYIGLKFFGVIGMFACIFILYALVALNEDGVIHITSEVPVEDSNEISAEKKTEVSAEIPADTEAE